MDCEKKKIKLEVGNDLEMRFDALERMWGLLTFDRLEIEQKLIEHQKQNEKLKDNVIRIKTEDEMICDENWTLITGLNNKVRELENQVLEKDRAVGAYHDRLHGFQTKVTKMEKVIEELKQGKLMDNGIMEDFKTKVTKMEQEIEELKQRKWIDNGIMKEFRSKLSESELREEELKEKNVEATRTVEKLRRRLLACKEEMRRNESETILSLDELRRQNLEASRSVEELRRHKMEAEHATKVTARELSKANNTVKELMRAVKELKEVNLAAHKEAEMHTKRFENLIPIAEDLTNLLKMNVEDLEEMKNKLVEKTPPSTEIIEIIDCDDKMSPSPNKRNKRNKKDCSDFSSIRIPKRKRSERRSVAANRKWMFGADMMKAFHEDDELCMQAVCALYRKQVSASESSQGSNRGFYHFEALRGRELAEYLIDEVRPMGSVKRRRFPDHVVNQCRRLAIDYSWYFAMSRIPCLDQDGQNLSLTLFV